VSFAALDALVRIVIADVGGFFHGLDRLGTHDHYTGMRVPAHAAAFRLVKGS
jgi:hypothetical protein